MREGAAIELPGVGGGVRDSPRTVIAIPITGFQFSPIFLPLVTSD